MTTNGGAVQKIEFLIRGLCPTLMNNGQVADPMNRWARAIKKIALKKNKKTDDDMEELARLEFMGALYLNEHGRPCWPSTNLEAMIRSGAKHTREGKLVQSSLFVTADAELIYEGPKSADGLWEAREKFSLRSTVAVNRARVMRTRPYFPEWQLKIEVMFNVQDLDRESVVSWVEVAGRMIGLSDWRPKYGRFDIVSHN